MTVREDELEQELEEAMADAQRADCDCCSLCIAAKSIIPCSYPEYCCVGYCGERGEAGHFRKKPASSQHPTLDYPERR